MTFGRFSLFAFLSPFRGHGTENYAALSRFSLMLRLLASASPSDDFYQQHRAGINVVPKGSFPVNLLFQNPKIPFGSSPGSSLTTSSPCNLFNFVFFTTASRLSFLAAHNLHSPFTLFNGFYFVLMP